MDLTNPAPARLRSGSRTRASRQARFAYFAFVGLGALIVAGAVHPRAAGLWQAIYLGVFLSALVWLLCKTWRWCRELPDRIGRRFRRKPTPPPVSPPTPPAAGGDAPAPAA